jgi:hypothetical protein
MNSLHVWGGKIKVYTEKGGDLCVHVYCVSAPKSNCVPRLSVLPGRTRTKLMHCKLEYMLKELQRVLYTDSKRTTQKTELGTEENHESFLSIFCPPVNILKWPMSLEPYSVGCLNEIGVGPC